MENNGVIKYSEKEVIISLGILEVKMYISSGMRASVCD